jgi:hypothetical protein
MILRELFKQVEVSPVPVKGIADLELDEKVYKPDFEITAKFQAFSKELVRIAFLGIGAYGVLIKMATEDSASKQRFMQSLQQYHHLLFAVAGVVAFAICAACALFHGLLASKCLAHQLNISRHLGRLESDRWADSDKELSRAYIKRQQTAQKSGLRIGSVLFFTATLSLAVGAASVAFCSVLVLLNK